VDTFTLHLRHDRTINLILTHFHEVLLYFIADDLLGHVLHPLHVRSHHLLEVFPLLRHKLTFLLLANFDRVPVVLVLFLDFLLKSTYC